MISRYLLSGQTKYIPSRTGSITYISNTTQTVTNSVQFLGEPGAVLGMQVTTFSHSNPGAVFKVGGISYVLNDTFNLILDGSGQITITMFLDVGTSTVGNGANAVITIETTTIGGIGLPNNAGISWTI